MLLFLAAGVARGEATTGAFALELNGLDRGIAFLERDASGAWCIEPALLREWRIRVARDAVGCVVLQSLPGARLVVDERRASARLEVSAEAFEPSALDLRPTALAAPQAGRGAWLSYDLSAQHARAAGNARQSGGAALSAAAFDGAWSLSHDAVVGRSGARGTATRVATTLRHEDPAAMRTWVLGDAVGSLGLLASPVRFGGIAWGTNFSLQPGFVPFPVATVQASAAFPSTVELLVNGERRGRYEVPPGPFELRGLPVPSGAGYMQVVTRDLLGREQVVSVPLYLTPAVLRSGVLDYRVEAGRLREGFGLRSNDYGDAFGAGQLRYGVTDRWTAEARLETAEHRMVGLATQVVLGTFGLATAGAAWSQGKAGGGHRWIAGFERQSRALSFGVRLSGADRAFESLGLPPGDGALARALAVSAGTSLGAWGSVNGAFTREQRHGGQPREVATVSYSATLRRDLAVVLSGGRIRDATWTNTFAALSLVANLAPEVTSSLALTHEARRTAALLQAQRTPIALQGTAWRVAATAGQDGRVEGGVAWQLPALALTLDTTLGRHGRGAVRAGAAGTLLILEKRLFATRLVGESFGVAHVPGHPGIRVYADNQEVGRTDEQGFVVVPRLTPWQRHTLRLDTADLPIDTHLGNPSIDVAPYARNGVVARFDVAVRRALQVVVVDAFGNPLPAGARAWGATASSVVGREGLLFLADARPGEEVRIEWAQGRCTARMPANDSAGLPPEPERVSCT